jgi:hypothetical protein
LGLADMLTETVAIRAYGGPGAYSPVYGAASSEDWYLEPKSGVTYNPQGQEVTYDLWAVAPAESTIHVNAEVSWGGTRYEVVGVAELRPRGIIHHFEVFLKSAGVTV